eukprot:gene18946-22673_t
MLRRSLKLFSNTTVGRTSTTTTTTTLPPNPIPKPFDPISPNMMSPQHPKTYHKSLTIDNICPTVKTAQYAVRGELVIRAENHLHTLERQRKEGEKLLPFEDIVYCNIGNPQQLKQQPLTFFRQVVALCECPELLSNEYCDRIFPADVIARAKSLLASINNTTGAYSGSQGVSHVLKNVASFIEQRDGFAADPNDIFLTDGASVAVQRVLRLLIRDRSDGILIPTPQYPLYSATIELYGGSQVGYLLNEELGWKLEVAELERAYQTSAANGVIPRALVIINPGNPTGQTLDRDNMEEIVQFCFNRNIVLLADEVYQENVYVASKPFISFKKVVKEMGARAEGIELFSFHSVSKGFVGECGKRGGYMELYGITSEVKAEIYKLASIGLCPNVIGQLVVDLMVRPPVAGDASFAQYAKERDTIYESLKRRALLLTSSLNQLEGVTCNPPEGAMYAFPQIRLPPRAVEEAKAQGKAADAFYCIALLDATGICVVPGSGFGQKDGTYHFRTTFLPSEQAIEGVCTKMADFHKSFMAKYK